MSGPSKDENILADGPRGRVEYAFTDDGASEAKAWLDSQPLNVRAKFSVLFHRLVAHEIHNVQQFRQYKGLDGVWEFKRDGDRIFCVQHFRRWLLTHHYGKGHSLKHQTNSAKRAIVIAHEHLERERREISRKKGKQ